MEFDLDKALEEVPIHIEDPPFPSIRQEKRSSGFISDLPSEEGRKLEHFLSRTEFEKASEGWYYSSSKRSALIKYRNPKKDAELLVSFEDLDLIGM